MLSWPVEELKDPITLKTAVEREKNSKWLKIRWF
jgi:hypothetical protein